MKKISTLLLSIFLIIISSSKAQTWLTMASGLGSSSETVKAIAENPVNHEVYAGGTFTGASLNYLAKWNNVSWDIVGTGINGPVYALAFKNQELYVGGLFTMAGGVAVHNVAKWSGGVWSDVGGGFNGQVNCIFVSPSSGTIYAAGSFSLSGTTAVNHVSKLVSNAWTSLGSGIGAVVNSLAEYGTPLTLFAGCEMVSAPVQKYNGTTSWSGVNGLSSGKVYALASFAGYLYAGGDFSSPTFAGAKYDGTNWGTIITTFSSTDKIYAFSPRYSTVLYIGGKFTNLGVGSHASYIARINSPTTPLQTITVTTSNISGEVYAIGNQSGKVIAGGKFASPATNIAITSTTIGIEELSKLVVDKSFYPNPVSGIAHLNITTSEKLKNPELTIFDIQSRVIMNLPVENDSNNELQFSIDCINLPAGNYYYLLTENGQNVICDKFVKE